MKHDFSTLEKKFSQALWLAQACGNLEIQVLEAARHGNQLLADGFSREAKDTLFDLERLLKSMGLGVLAKKFRENTEGYLVIAKQYFG